MIKRILLVLLFISKFAHSEQLQFAAFPLKSENCTILFNWIGYALPEMVGRNGGLIKGIKVWDPIFLKHQDSSFSISASDSLILAHQDRWQWDIGLGGCYSVDKDSVNIQLEIVNVTRKGNPVKTVIKMSGSIDKIEILLTELLLKAIVLVKIPLNEDDSLHLFTFTGASATAYKTYIAGYGMEMNGNYDGAVTAYHRAVELSEHFKFALCRLGRLYLFSERYEQAQYFFKALEETANDPIIAAEVANYLIESQQHRPGVKFIASHRNLLELSSSGLKAIGKMNLAGGEYQRAVANLTKAVASGASDLDIDLNLGMAYLSTGDYDRATEIFNRLLRFRPDYPRYYSCLGAAHRKAGRLMESCRVLEAALKIDPENATILNDLAISYIELKWYQKAIQLLLQAVENSPQLHDAYLNLGVAYWRCGQKAESAKWLNTAMQFPHLRQSVFVNYGNIFYSDGRIRSAIRMYKKAAKKGDMSISVYRNLAQAYESAGKLKKAYYNYKLCLVLSPNHIEILFKLAIISEMMHKYSEAEHYYQKLLEIEPYNKSAVNGIVKLLLKEGKLEEAVKPIESYLLSIPSDKVFMLQLADVYRQMGWYEVAIMKYQAIIRDFPDEAEGYYGLGRCVLEMKKNKGNGSYEDAIYVLKQAAGLDAENPEPEILIGDIYMQNKGYRELAIDHWKKAIVKVKNTQLRKELQQKIKRAGM